MGCELIRKAPVNFTDGLKNVRGVDDSGTDALLRRKNGLLFGPDGDIAARWSDGSDEFPIHLPGMKEQVTPGSGVVVKGVNGRIYSIIPKDNGRFTLVADGGQVFLEDEATNKTTFSRDDILSFSGCDFRFAVFEGCSPDGSFKLRQISRDELCANLDTASGASALLGCSGEGMRAIKPSVNGQMLIGKDGEWVEEPADMRFRHIGATLYVGLSSIFTYKWSDYSIPAVGAAGKILAELLFILTVTSGNSAQVNARMDGVIVDTAYVGTGLGIATKQVRHQVIASPGGTFTLQGTYAGPIIIGNMTCELLGYFH